MGALLAAGARCYVPYRREHEAAEFASPADAAVTLIPAPSLADEKEVIGRGFHERFIIDTAKFLARLEAKAAS